MALFSSRLGILSKVTLVPRLVGDVHMLHSFSKQDTPRRQEPRGSFCPPSLFLVQCLLITHRLPYKFPWVKHGLSEVLAFPPSKNNLLSMLKFQLLPLKQRGRVKSEQSWPGKHWARPEACRACQGTNQKQLSEHVGRTQRSEASFLFLIHL